MRTFQQHFKECESILKKSSFYSNPTEKDLDTLREFYDSAHEMVQRPPLCHRYAAAYVNVAVPRLRKTLEMIAEKKPGVDAHALTDDNVPMNLQFLMRTRLMSFYGLASDNYTSEQTRLLAHAETKDLIPGFDTFLKDVGNEYVKNPKAYWGCTVQDAQSGQLTLTLFGMYIADEKHFSWHKRNLLEKIEGITPDDIKFVYIEEEKKWQIQLHHFEKTAYCQIGASAARPDPNNAGLFSIAPAPRVLRNAAHNGELNKVLMCISQLSQGEINEPGPESQKTALHRAAAAGHLDVCKVLKGVGADSSLEDKEGHTAQQLAEANGHSEVAELLSDQSAAASANTRGERRSDRGSLGDEGTSVPEQDPEGADSFSFPR